LVMGVGGFMIKPI